MPTEPDPHERLAELSRSWGVELGRIEQTPSSVIGFGERSNEPVVLKVALRRHDEWHAGEVVSAFEGKGMVRALEHVPGAVLVEWLQPGTALVDRVEPNRDSDANRVFIEVIEEMSASGADTQGFPRAEEWGGGFDEYLADSGGGVPRELAAEARTVFFELCRTQPGVQLLHGDLQHYNVLWSERRGWAAIDPKGVVAEVAFELGAVLRNPVGMADLHTRSGIKRRLDQLAGGLGLDAVRVAGWAFAQAVLSAIWMIQDQGPGAQVQPALRVGRNVRYLLP